MYALALQFIDLLLKMFPAYIVTRFLMQALSNIITANENLIERLWNRYMDYSENQNIILSDKSRIKYFERRINLTSYYGYIIDGP